MPTERDRPIVPVLLFGPMGVGKSTLAPILAAELGRPHVDLDELVRARAGRSIEEIFRSDGEARFRELERDALVELLGRGDGPVIALGGGTLVEASLRERALDEALVVSLRAPTETLVARVGSGVGRPLLDGVAPAAATVSRLMTERREAYEEGAFSFDTSASPPEELARRIATAIRGTRSVRLAGAPASRWALVTDEPWAALRNIVDRASATRTLAITDSTVAKLYLEAAASTMGSRFADEAIVVPDGERSKQLSSAEVVLEGLAARGADRRSLVVSLGGGVVSDLAGFAASIYMRGVPWVAVATSTVAMVDAALGGKTAVDLGSRKNSVGSFHLPLATIISPTFARTEGARAVRSGLAEAIKTFAVADRASFERLESLDAGGWLSEDTLRFAIEASALAKAAIVRADPLDRGRRAILNFGHTFGHALESVGGFSRWTHGEAVALGMVAALRVGVRAGISEPRAAARVEAALARAGLPVSLAADDLQEAVRFLSADKKRAGDVVHFVLLNDLGAARIEPIALDHLERMARSLADASSAFGC